MHEFTGSTIPFPETAAEQQQTADPRLSIAERYGDSEGYVAAIRAAADALVAQQLMLAEDIERCVELARLWSAPRHDIRLL